MKNEFKKILDLLENVNKNRRKKIVSLGELTKEYQRIDDLHLLDKKSVKQLDLLEKTYDSSIDDIMKPICNLDVYLGTYVWHIESMRDITENFIVKDSKND